MAVAVAKAVEELTAGQAKMTEAEELLDTATDTSKVALMGFENKQAKALPRSKEQQLRYRHLAGEALASAKEALVSFRRAGETQNKIAALKVVVAANMAMGKSFDALMAASDELTMLKRAGEKAAQVEVLQVLTDVQLKRCDTHAAVVSASEALEMHRELGDKAGEAKALRTLASLQVYVGKGLEAVRIASTALGIFQQLGDQEGAAACTQMINKGYAESDQFEKAPNRADATKSLELLASAVENKDKSAWDSAIRQLNESSAYSQLDVQRVFNDAIKNDSTAAAFLKKQGVGKSSGNTPELVMKEISRVGHYLNFRVNGLGYGPRFRCVKPNYVAMVPGDLDTAHAVTNLQISSAADDWERQLEFHPGILDGMLQATGGVAQVNELFA